MQTTVAVIGGGLSGLYAARLLMKANIDVHVFEARDRLGGRILSEDRAGTSSEGGFDLGPSWFWPKMQPKLAALTRELGMAAFPQHSEGDILFERMEGEAVQRFPSIRQEPESMRFAGGAGALVAALAADLQPQRLYLQRRLTHVALEAEGVELKFSDHDGTSSNVRANQVLLALPPRLAAATISFAPALNAANEALWWASPTWMAAHAKFVAVYERPFWREDGLSGTAQSRIGPLAEIYDATTGESSAALFGFLGVSASQRAEVGERELTRACVAQLARLFGDEAAQPSATLLKDWAADPLTATKADERAGGHPIATHDPWVSGPWAEHLALGASETSISNPGYLAGAIEAAERAVSDIEIRLRSVK